MINEVFGTQLGMSFVISPGLQEKKDLVTLRLTFNQASRPEGVHLRSGAHWRSR